LRGGAILEIPIADTPAAVGIARDILHFAGKLQGEIRLRLQVIRELAGNLAKIDIGTER